MLSVRRRWFTLIALSLVACGSEGKTPDDTEESPTRDAAVVARDGGLDAGEKDDAAQLDAAVEPPRDATSAVDAAVEIEDAASAAGRDAGSDAGRDAGGATSPLTPAFHIPLRVHRADSGLSGAQLAAVLEEVNQIWWKQAGVCFEVEVVRGEQVRSDGFDFWFHRSQVGCNTSANGVYCGDHDIHSLDTPNLGAADDPAWQTKLKPARTTAHELGHGLNLEHYNGHADSNDSLMSSGRQGFKLHEAEIGTARRRAQSKASADSPASPCAAVPVVD